MPQNRWTWDEATLRRAVEEHGFTVQIESIHETEARLITEKDLGGWFNREKSPWGRFMAEALGEGLFTELYEKLGEIAGEGPVEWHWQSLLLCGVK
jgi:hypothetical protein